MLIISRKVSESVVLLQDGIEIIVTDISGGQVKLGIKAPKSKKIVRREIIDQITRTNCDSAVDSSKIDLDDISEMIKRK